MNATSHSNLFSVDRPKDHDIEAIRPHMRKHLQPFKLLINSAPAGEKPQVSEVTVQGTNYADAKKRFKAMTGGEVAFIAATAPKRGRR